MQSIVGGLIEPVYFEENGCALCFCNEEFLLNDSAPNRVIGNTLIHGTCFVCGDGYNDEGERDSCTLTDEQVDKYTTASEARQSIQMAHSFPTDMITPADLQK